MSERLMGSREVAELLGVNVRTVQLWAKNGVLPAMKVGRLLRFSPLEIQQRLNEFKIR